MFLSGLGFSQNFNINISPNGDTIYVVNTVNGNVPVLDSVKIGDNIVIICKNWGALFVIDTNGTTPSFHDTLVGSAFNGQILGKYKINKNSSLIYIADSAIGSTQGLATINFYVRKDTSTGINEVYYQSGFKVFPNPCNDVLNIQSEITITKIEILDLLGGVVKSINISSVNSYRIGVSGIPSGIYFLRINGILIQKFSINL